MAKKKQVVTEEPTTVPSLNRAIAEINKKYGGNKIGLATNLQINRIPTNIQVLDDALGGGFPFGRMVELFGVPSSGKSLISLVTIKQAQEKGLDCVYVDVEGGFDSEFAKRMGVNVDKLVIMSISEGEDIFDIISYLLKTQPAVVVVDSVAALITVEEMEGSLKDKQMAIKARLMSKALAKVNALNKKTLFLFINQLRSTLAMYGASTTTPGGRALDHYSSIRLEVKQGDKITADGKKTTKDVIGQTVQFRVTKNKTFIPFKYGSFNFMYDGEKIV